MVVYEIRGYGKTPGEATMDAFQRFNEDPFENATDQWEWV